MRNFVVTLAFCLVLSGCGKRTQPDFDDIQLPVVNSAWTYHGPGMDSVIRIDKDNNLRLETPERQSYINPTHDVAVAALRFACSPNKYPRVHIFFDRRATVAPVILAYEMIQDGGMDGYIFAVNIEGDGPLKKFPPTNALLFEVPSPEIRAQLLQPRSRMR